MLAQIGIVGNGAITSLPGDLDIVGDLTVSGDTLCQGSLTLSSGGPLSTTSSNLQLLPATGRITQVGDAGSTSHGLNTNDDLFVSGKLEVDGEASFDGGGTFSGNALFGGVLSLPYNESVLAFITNSDANSRIIVGSTWDQLIWVLGSGVGTALTIANSYYDYDHSDQPDPTVFCHSRNQSKTEWLGLSCSPSDATIDWGSSVGIDFAGGSATASTVTHDEYWEVKIGGVTKKIMLGS
jgi:hypothetical protein